MNKLFIPALLEPIKIVHGTALQRALSQLTRSPWLRILYKLIKFSGRFVGKTAIFLNNLLMPTQHLRILYNHFLLLCVLVGGKLAWHLCFDDLFSKIRGLCVRYFIYTPEQNARRAELSRKIAAADDYEEWKALSDELDDVEGRSAWRHTPAPELFDLARLRRHTELLRALMAAGDVHGLMWHLRGTLSRNALGINNPLLYGYLRAGTKAPVEAYVCAVLQALWAITRAERIGMPAEEEDERVERGERERGGRGVAAMNMMQAAAKSTSMGSGAGMGTGMGRRATSGFGILGSPASGVTVGLNVRTSADEGDKGQERDGAKRAGADGGADNEEEQERRVAGSGLGACEAVAREGLMMMPRSIRSFQNIQEWLSPGKKTLSGKLSQRQLSGMSVGTQQLSPEFLARQLSISGISKPQTHLPEFSQRDNSGSVHAPETKVDSFPGIYTPSPPLTAATSATAPDAGGNGYYTANRGPYTAPTHYTEPTAYPASCFPCHAPPSHDTAPLRRPSPRRQQSLHPPMPPREKIRPAGKTQSGIHENNPDDNNGHSGIIFGKSQSGKNIPDSSSSLSKSFSLASAPPSPPSRNSRSQSSPASPADTLPLPPLSPSPSSHAIPSSLLPSSSLLAPSLQTHSSDLVYSLTPPSSTYQPTPTHAHARASTHGQPRSPTHADTANGVLASPKGSADPHTHVGAHAFAAAGAQARTDTAPPIQGPAHARAERGDASCVDAEAGCTHDVMNACTHEGRYHYPDAPAYAQIASGGDGGPTATPACTCVAVGAGGQHEGGAAVAGAPAGPLYTGMSAFDEGAPPLSSLSSLSPSPSLASSPPPSPPAAPPPSLADRLSFFYELRHAFGRTAILFSGGATMGLYHAGVARELAALGLMPRIISGSSVGSIIAAICATRTDAELLEVFAEDKQTLDFSFFSAVKEGWLNRLVRMFTGQGVLDGTVLTDAIRNNVGEWTFQEAYERTGKVLNITVSPAYAAGNTEGCRLLNHLTAPSVLVWSAVIASCAIPLVYPSVELLARARDGSTVSYLIGEEVRWEDGSIASDLPVQRLGELFNVNHCIVSQVNPHVVPLLTVVAIRGSRKESAWRSWLRQPVASFIEYIGSELTALLHRLTHFSPLTPPAYLSLLVHQSYRGHITLTPTFTFTDYLLLLRNPTPERFRHCVRVGQRMLWRRAVEITMACAAERVMAQCIEVLKREIKREERQRARAAQQRGGRADVAVAGRSRVVADANGNMPVCMAGLHHPHTHPHAPTSAHARVSARRSDSHSSDGGDGGGGGAASELDAVVGEPCVVSACMMAHGSAGTASGRATAGEGHVEALLAHPGATTSRAAAAEAAVSTHAPSYEQMPGRRGALVHPLARHHTPHAPQAPARAPEEGTYMAPSSAGPQPTRVRVSADATLVGGGAEAETADVEGEGTGASERLGAECGRVTPRSRSRGRERERDRERENEDVWRAMRGSDGACVEGESWGGQVLVTAVDPVAPNTEAYDEAEEDGEEEGVRAGVMRVRGVRGGTSAGVGEDGGRKRRRLGNGWSSRSSTSLHHLEEAERGEHRRGAVRTPAPSGELLRGAVEGDEGIVGTGSERGEGDSAATVGAPETRERRASWRYASPYRLHQGIQSFQIPNSHTDISGLGKFNFSEIVGSPSRYSDHSQTKFPETQNSASPRQGGHVGSLPEDVAELRRPASAASADGHQHRHHQRHLSAHTPSRGDA